MVSTGQPDSLAPLIVLVGPTASGKSSLALRLAEQFDGEIVSCDSVAVYREMEIGTAKPSLADRARIPHHMLDLVSPAESCTAGEYGRLARVALEDITRRTRLPIVAGGTGLYLRALIDGFFPAPEIPAELRAKLRQRVADRGAEYLHRILQRLDRRAAEAIHANDIPKVVRAIEVSLVARRPFSEQWAGGRDALSGYRILRLGLQPARDRLYERISGRAAEMFERGLVEETAGLVERYGLECRPLQSLGYAQSVAELQGRLTRAEAIAAAQQGHRNYAKRQGTWFRREPEVRWLSGFGSDDAVITGAMDAVGGHLRERPAFPDRARPPRNTMKP